MISATNQTTISATSIGTIEKYLIVKEIEPDTHLYPVYLATYSDKDTKEPTKCVIKAISDLTAYQRELAVYALDAHPNLLQCLEVIENHTITFGRCKDKSYHLLVFPFLENGDFLDLLYKTYLDERTLRYYAERILNAIEYLHLNGLAHRDIKPENILLDSKFDPVLIDFGHTTSHSDLAGPILFNTRFDATTPGICPPEFRRGRGYYGVQMDLFALGRLIFIQATGMQPFGNSSKQDAFYQMIEKEQWDEYWNRIETFAKKKWMNFTGLSSELKELLQGLLSANELRRPSIEEIRKSSWYVNVEPKASDEIQCALMRAKFA